MGGMTKRIADPLGQLHLFGQLDIFDQAADLEAPRDMRGAGDAGAPAALERHDYAGTTAYGSQGAAHCSCGWESQSRRLAATLLSDHRAHQLEAAAAQGRADVLAGADPFAGLPT